VLVRNYYYLLILRICTDQLWIMAQNNIMIRRNNIDEITMKQMMGYLRIEDHDLFAGYVRRLGIDHQD
jgi:hypothetical protein